MAQEISYTDSSNFPIARSGFADRQGGLKVGVRKLGKLTHGPSPHPVNGQRWAPDGSCDLGYRVEGTLAASQRPIHVVPSIIESGTGLIMIQRISYALIVALLLTGCSGMPENNVDPASVTELDRCPSSPNCVSSADTGDSHYIAPITIDGDPDAAWQALKDILTADRSIKITASGEHYIRAEATTRILRFTDDLEFLLKGEERRIDMRSASRVGYSDLGKNRKRMEGIRSEMIDAGVAVASQ